MPKNPYDNSLIFNSYYYNLTKEVDQQMSAVYSQLSSEPQRPPQHIQMLRDRVNQYLATALSEIKSMLDNPPGLPGDGKLPSLLEDKVDEFMSIARIVVAGFYNNAFVTDEQVQALVDLFAVAECEGDCGNDFLTIEIEADIDFLAKDNLRLNQRLDIAVSKIMHDVAFYVQYESVELQSILTSYFTSISDVTYLNSEEEVSKYLYQVKGFTEFMVMVILSGFFDNPASYKLLREMVVDQFNS